MFWRASFSGDSGTLREMIVATAAETETPNRVSLGDHKPKMSVISPMCWIEQCRVRLRRRLLPCLILLSA